VNNDFATHDQVEALTLADRIVVLDKGVVQQVGTPMELYEKPANLFVARFIGSPMMNLLDVTVQRDQLILAQSETRIPCAGFEQLTTARQLGIRPEHLQPTEPGCGHLQGIVEVVERLGSDSFVYVQVPGAGRLLGRCSGNTPLKPGDTMGLLLDLPHLHLFDQAGQSLAH
jgi:multiple sugar transport system ATP-binding protein